MPRGLAWKICLFAFLLSVGQADISNDLKEGDHSADSKTAVLSNLDNDEDDSNESNAESEELTETWTEKGITQSDGGVIFNDNRRNNEHELNSKIIIKQEKVGPGAPRPFVYLPGPESAHVLSDNQGDNTSALRHQYVELNVRDGPRVLHDDLVYPNVPSNSSREAKIEYPLNSANEGGLMMPAHLAHPSRLVSRLIPLEEHILLHNIPGAQYAIVCSKEGDLYNFWAPSIQCMVCVCRNTYGKLRPVCVSCSTCLVPPGRHSPPAPYTTSGPPVPPSPDNKVLNVSCLVSCKPLPTNVPFQSPLDPCKICVCIESFTQFGKIEVEINCQHNPDCVLPPPYVTSTRPIPTPIPLPVCDKLPQNVPFPHPQDPCKICQCSTKLTPQGISEQQIDCHTSPECLQTLEPEKEGHEPYTETPEPITVAPEPEPEICDRYPEDVVFPHPLDPCQMCKCTVRSNIFFDKKKITCYVKPNCLPTPKPVTTTTSSPRPPAPGLHPDNVRCAPLPNETPFQNPLNPCQICVCTERADVLGRLDVQIECQENPQCILPYDVTTLPPYIVTPVPLPACKHFPENVLFPHPNDPCEVCKCSVLRTAFGIPEQHINCYARPECVPTPEPTETPEPEPLYLCDQYPDNVIFADPLDPCKLCKCYQDVFQHKHIICALTPECAPTTTPSPYPGPTTPAPSPAPEPETVSCAPLPSGKLFTNPLNPCQICICTERADLIGRHDVQIECEENPECVVPSDIPTLPPIIVKPIPLPACKQFPESVLFPHPSDACQECKCNVQINYMGIPEQHINCFTREECLPTPSPITVSPGHELPLPYDQCSLYGFDALFIDPHDPCRLCQCTRTRGPSGSLDVVVKCYMNPECHLRSTTEPPPPEPAPSSSPRPMPTSERPQPKPYDVCGNYPMNTPFNDPTDPCRICICSFSQSPGAGPPSLSHAPPYRPAMQVQCQLKPECYPPPPEPLTTSPAPYPSPTPAPDIVSCMPLPTGTPFQNPLNPCQVCVCTETVNLFGRPDVNIKCQENSQCVLPYDVTTVPPNPDKPVPLPACAQLPTNVEFPHPQDPCQVCKCTVQVTPWGVPEQHISCHTRPECGPSTIAPPGPMPEPLESVSCKPLPTGTPFQNPLNPCQVCICKETVDLFGRPDVNIECQDNSQCVVPYDVITVPPNPDKPVPLPTCAQLPTNVEFPHPQDPCQVCKCTVHVTPWGVPEQHISCHTRPECEPPGLITIAPHTPDPEPSICDGYPENALFPLPQDPCRMCRCTVEISAYGASEQKIDCFINPACSSRTTPAQRPPAPPSPLPGPSPHESCTPYIPSKPFQHPWDECQVCVCKEAISTRRITIEVNCYTKPSCCVEPPLDIPGLPGSSSSGGLVIGPMNGSPIRSSGGKIIGSSGEHFFDHSGERSIGPADGNVIEILHDGVNRPSGQNLIGPYGGHLIRPAHSNMIEITGDRNVFGPLDRSLIGPVSENMNKLSGVKIVGLSDQNLIEPSGGNLFFSSGENRHIPWGGKNWGGTSSEDVIGTREENNWSGFLSGNVIGPDMSPTKIDLLPIDKPGGIIYVPNKGNLVPNRKPIENLVGTSQWTGNQNYINPGQEIRGQYLHPIGQSRVKYGDRNHYKISPNLEYRDGARTDHAKAEAEAFSQDQKGTPKSSAVVHYSTKMRTKSARPSDNDSMDYD